MKTAKGIRTHKTEPPRSILTWNRCVFSLRCSWAHESPISDTNMNCCRPRPSNVDAGCLHWRKLFFANYSTSLDLCPTLEGHAQQSFPGKFILCQHWRGPADNHDTDEDMFQVNIDQGWLLNLVSVGATSDCMRDNELRQHEVTLIMEVLQPGSCHKCSRGWWVSTNTQHRHAIILGPETQHLDTFCQIRTDLAQEGKSMSLKRGFLCLVEAKHQLLQ